MSKSSYLTLIFILTIAFSCKPIKQRDNSVLRLKLEKISESYKAIVGIAIINLEDGDTLSLNNSHNYPMQSVYKFPLAMAVLSEVDKGNLSLNQKVHVTKEDVQPSTWSQLKKDYPEGNIDVSIAQLLNYTVSMSDNIACDLLFKIMKGPDKVGNYIHQLGFKDIEIVSTEHQMHSEFKEQYKNWCKPMTMSRLLEGFYQNKYLSDSSHNFLMRLLTESSNSANRIKALLPIETMIAHKTGTSDTNELGVRSACNDVGIITLPNGKHIVLSVFVSESEESFETTERIIAEIAKETYDYFDTRTQLRTSIDSLLTAKTSEPFNGVILISEKGKTAYSRVCGYSDLELKKPLMMNSQFVIGSISKQITAALVLREFDKGNLKLDVPIKKYLPQLKMAWANEVTVHHLLTHMHGIVRLDTFTAFKPGTKFDYGLSNVGYHLLSQIVEQTSGKSFATLSQELFEQLGMWYTFHPDIKKYSELVKGYTNQPNGKIEFEKASFENSPAAGGFISTAHDLLIWNNSLHAGKILTPETYTLMVSKMKEAVRQHPIFGITEYGYGITVKTTYGIKLGQTGFAPGFTSMSYYFPESQRSVIVLQNVVYDRSDLKKTFFYHTRILNFLENH